MCLDMEETLFLHPLLRPCLPLPHFSETQPRSNSGVCLYRLFNLIPARHVSSTASAVLTGVTVKITVFWNVTVCSLVGHNLCFGGTWCLHFQGGTGEKHLHEDYCCVEQDNLPSVRQTSFRWNVLSPSSG
jgi:hypothetical protein